MKICEKKNHLKNSTEMCEKIVLSQQTTCAPHMAKASSRICRRFSAFALLPFPFSLFFCLKFFKKKNFFQFFEKAMLPILIY